jgi:hypothetical protein
MNGVNYKDEDVEMDENYNDKESKSYNPSLSSNAANNPNRRKYGYHGKL